jgi:hypothetical protein
MEKETDRPSEEGEEEEFYKLRVSPFFSQKSQKKEANSPQIWKLCCLKRYTEHAYAKKLLLPVPVLHTETTKAQV